MLVGLSEQIKLKTMDSIRFHLVPVGQIPWPEKIRKICDHLGIDHREMMGRSRYGAIVTVRYAIMKHAIKDRMTLSDVGRLFKRDHATVIHGMRRIRNHEFTGSDYRMQLAIDAVNDAINQINSEAI